MALSLAEPTQPPPLFLPHSPPILPQFLFLPAVVSAAFAAVLAAAADVFAPAPPISLPPLFHPPPLLSPHPQPTSLPSIMSLPPIFCSRCFRRRLCFRRRRCFRRRCCCRRRCRVCRRLQARPQHLRLAGVGRASTSVPDSARGLMQLGRSCGQGIIFRQLSGDV